VAGRVLLTLFQFSYKGFRKKFFKVCCSVHDPTLLDGFPLYWVEKPGLKKPRSLEDLSLPDREVCGFLSSLGVAFNNANLIKNEMIKACPSPAIYPPSCSKPLSASRIG